MLWVDPTDPSVFAAVTGSEMPDPPDEHDLDEVRYAVAVASEILTLATAHLVHPAGEQTEEFISRHFQRLTPVYGPVTSVTSLVAVGEGGTETPLTGWRLVGGTVHLTSTQQGASLPLWRINRVGSDYSSGEIVYRMVYRFGSTLTRGARKAVLEYARQLWLAATGSDECRLPDRTTSVTREGIGIELLTPQDFLDRGRTGLEDVDVWLSQVNPKRAFRPSAVYTPDSPPGVGVRTRRL